MQSGSAADSHTKFYPNSYSDSNTNCRSYSYGDRDGDSNSNSHRHSYGNSDRYGHTDIHTDGNAEACESYSHTKTASDSAAPALRLFC